MNLDTFIIENPPIPLTEMTRDIVEEEERKKCEKARSEFEEKLKQAEEEKAKKKRASKSFIKYTLELETNIDFVVKKQTSRTMEKLCVLIGKGQYYIENNKGERYNLLKEPEPVKVVKQFLYKLGDDGIAFQNLSWIEDLYRDSNSVNNLINIIKDEVMTEIIRKGLYSIKSCTDPISVCRDYTMNKSVYSYVFKKYGCNPAGFATSNWAYRISETLDYISKIFGLNNAYDFIDRCMLNLGKLQHISSSLATLIQVLPYINSYTYYNFSRKSNTVMGYSYSTTHNEGKGYRFTYKNFADFVFGPLLDEGFNINIWRDYLDMASTLGPIKDKYPKDVQTMHDIISYKYGIIKSTMDTATINSFKEKVAAYMDLEYKDTVSNFCVVVPKDPVDIADEGTALGHCVKSYIPKIASGESIICFLRQKKHPDIPLITIEVINNVPAKICGERHRRCTVQEEAVIKRWAKEKKLGTPVFDTFD